MAIRISEEKYNELLELSDGNTDLLCELIDKFLEHTPELLQEARKALEAGDAAKVDYYVHTMKGSALSIGFVPLSEFLVNLNRRSKVNDLAGFAEAFDQIEQALTEISEYRKSLNSGK